MTPNVMQQAARAIQKADALFIGAGAGMGVDSRLPDFRGSEGFWRAYPPLAALNLRFEEIATPHWFRDDPALAWGFYGHRRNLYRDTLPHAGFDLLKRWADQKPGGSFVFTSNVDGHFQKAGFAPDTIVECHGNIFATQCSRPCRTALWHEDAPVDVDVATMRATPPFPACPHCGAIARPNILMFNDGTWLPERTDTQVERLSEWLNTLHTGELVVIEMGAGNAIPTVRALSERLVRQTGASFIRINPREPEGPPGVISLSLPALDALQQIDQALQRHS